METYNTQRAHIKLPQYGRSVQKMVEYCMTIPDRKKRNRFAAGIVKSMSELYRENSGNDINVEALWDHLARISAYQLDIDYPCPILPKENVDAKPDPIPYTQQQIHYRNYGKMIENSIQKACETESANDRIQLFELVANQMKRIFHLQNPAADEDDNKIIHDLLDYTEGKFSEDIYQVYLYPAKELLKISQYNPATVEPSGKKKKKKKK